MYSILTISFTSIISDIWKKSNEQTPNRTLLCKKALHFIHKFRIFSGHHWNGIQTYFTIPLLCINKFQKSTQLQICTPLQKKCTNLELIFIFFDSKIVHLFERSVQIWSLYLFFAAPNLYISLQRCGHFWSLTALYYLSSK